MGARRPSRGEAGPRPATASGRAARRAAAVLAGGAVAAVVLEHLRFILRDGRLPRDLNLAFERLPGVVDALSRGDARRLLAAVLDPGGAWQVLVAGWLAVLGVGPLSWRLLDLLWVGLALAAGAGFAWRLGGPWAGAAAALLLGAVPGIAVQGRLGWIHVPEAALVLAAAWAWAADPALRRARAVAAVAGAGALALALRPSAAAWLGPLAVAMVATRAGWRRLVLVAGLWTAAALPWALRLGPYLRAKAGARARYETVVPPLARQLLDLLGPAGAAALALAALLALLPAPPGGLAPDRRAGLRLAWVWAVLPAWLFAAFQAGADNHLVGLAAALVLAGVGLARRPRLGLPAALAAFAVGLAGRWTPGDAASRSILDARHPFDGWPWRDAVALIDATCPPASCRIGVDQGLFVPYGEEPGRLELFLIGRRDVELVDLRDGAAGGVGRLDALITWDCGHADEAWRRRFPDSAAAVAELLEAGDLRPAWSRPVDARCRPVWFTPGGTVAHPERLPPGNDVPGRAR